MWRDSVTAVLEAREAGVRTRHRCQIPGVACAPWLCVGVGRHISPLFATRTQECHGEGLCTSWPRTNPPFWLSGPRDPERQLPTTHSPTRPGHPTDPGLPNLSDWWQTQAGVTPEILPNADCVPWISYVIRLLTGRVNCWMPIWRRADTTGWRPATRRDKCEHKHAKMKALLVDQCGPRRGWQEGSIVVLRALKLNAKKVPYYDQRWRAKKPPLGRLQ